MPATRPPRPQSQAVQPPVRGPRPPQRDTYQGPSGQPVNVNKLWHDLKFRIKGLQEGKRLAADAELYESGISVVRKFLVLGNIKEAINYANEIGKRQASAGFLSFELIKDYQNGMNDPNSAKGSANKASSYLKQHKKDVEKEEQRQRKRKY